MQHVLCVMYISLRKTFCVIFWQMLVMSILLFINEVSIRQMSCLKLLIDICF